MELCPICGHWAKELTFNAFLEWRDFYLRGTKWAHTGYWCFQSNTKALSISSKAMVRKPGDIDFPEPRSEL